MGHGMTDIDNALFRHKRAWHSMGIVVNTDETPTDALIRINGDWLNEPWDLYARDPKTGQEIKVESHKANMRSDTKTVLGIVGRNYAECQNLVLADFCESLAKHGDKVIVESVGTLFGGRKIWFLLRGESFSIRGDDMFPYIGVVNGHDGLTCIHCTNTHVRYQCANTVGSVVPLYGDKGVNLSQNDYCIRHTGKVHDKLNEVREALRLYEYAKRKSIEIFKEMANREIKGTADLRKFFFDAYEATLGVIPTMPSTKGEQVRFNRAHSALHSFERRWDDEEQIGGANYWSAYNAFTGMIQHDMKARGKDDVDRVERRINSNLFGLNNERSIRAMELALNV